MIEQHRLRTKFEGKVASRRRDAMEILKGFEERCRTPADKLKKVAEDLVAMMHRGLEDEDSSCVKMLVSYVNCLPTGDEVGLFYALDLGGTNFRVMQVLLQGRNSGIKQKQRSYKVPSELKVGKLHELFDYMAERVAAFIREEEEGSDFHFLPGQKRELGFTFSFPVHNKEINSGTLVRWTKSYDMEDAMCKDVVEELKKALEKQGLEINVTALVNDTVGTVAEGRYYDKDCVAGVILGTGTNAAYVEHVKQIQKLRGSLQNSEHVVINMEWGNFQSLNLPFTEYDLKLDCQSLHPHEQILEKMISGEYLGEIVRRVLLKMAEEDSFFGEIVPPKLKQPYILGTDVLSAMHDDPSSDHNMVDQKLSDVLEIHDLPLEKRIIIVKLCDIVTKRGARLSAAAMLGILKKLGRDRRGTDGKVERTVIAIDGSLYGKYELFRKYLKDALGELLDNEVFQMVSLQQATDGSGIGAAIVAATHSINSLRS
ncbi:hypothetical protein Nepgr_005559 [Nepenthes gracilis]|uniref:Phosphotransferase n=1 Tax=Nepenthes gracilis TaxID=150966 RepID=A0AAD3XGJ7_NEPGR|nr:hypothetical protein Nepgr_005559 [Nepenthes gracilis]